MSAFPAYPAPGCVVEYLEDNAPKIAMTLEAANGRLRLLLPSRKEVKLAQNRILPWLGPQYSPSLTREEYIKILEERKEKRERLTAEINPLELWETTQGEVEEAETPFFAELAKTDPDEDDLAATGRALLACKTHFRFQPPFFAVYDADLVEKKTRERKAREEREALISGGAAFLRQLWEAASYKKKINPELAPSPLLADRLEKILRERVINPDAVEDDSLWQLLSKSLPEVPHLPLQLLIAWGKLPEHYNFWLDRAGYEPGDQWWLDSAGEVERIAASGRDPASQPVLDAPFISVDSEHTKDIDDAFAIEPLADGWRVTVALANPALNWPFGDELDKKVRRRATSLYLPEGDLHMLPEILGADAFSLRAGEPRPAFCLEFVVDGNGDLASFRPFAASVKLGANLNYKDVQAVIDDASARNPAATYADALREADKMARTREARRVDQGAIVMRKEESSVILEETAEGVVVRLEPEPPTPDATRLVTELMVAASAGFAQWAGERDLPVIHRTQNVTVPREFAGVWDRPEDLSRLMRSLAHSILEIDPRPHAALGLARYAPVTSPLRRYADMLNEAQALTYLEQGKPRWSREEMEKLLDALTPDLEAASQAQRFRPRYWRLWYFRQQGEKVWWDAVVTEENENFVNVALPSGGLLLRGKRALFDERVQPGAAARVRVGKINPLYNEIQILEVLPQD